MLKNKHESKISQLSERNSELSLNLKNKQNDLTNLKKEYLYKLKNQKI